jgi:hypothetical protein
MSARRVIAFAAAAALAACRTEPAVEPPPEPHEIFVERLPSLPEGHPDVASLQVAGRAARRLSVDQIELSIDALGNLAPGTIKLPADLAITLGRPDYGRLFEESLEPSPLFMKFMLDLGAYACNGLSDFEPSRPAAQRLMTRFGSAAYQRGANAGTRERGGYEAACIALFTSPEFLLY